MEDDIICTEKIIAERKTFFLDLKQNARGKVVRITEKVSSNRDRIMVPAEILDDFIAALQDIRETLKQQGNKFPPSLLFFISPIAGLRPSRHFLVSGALQIRRAKSRFV